MTKRNRLKAKLARGDTAIGLSCALGNAQIAEEFAMAGFDFIYIDQQHGLTSQDTLVTMLRAIAPSTTTPLVRVARNDSALVGLALDAGAEGIIVPMVNTPQDAADAAQACRYHPEGQRSWGPIRARYGLGTDPDSVNREVICLVMIETVEGLRNLREILAVPGVDGIYIGPADLGVTLGGAPRSYEQATDQQHVEAIHQIREACAEAGLIAGISGNPERLAPEGFNMVTAGMDFSLLRAALDRLPRPAAVPA